MQSTKIFVLVVLKFVVHNSKGVGNNTPQIINEENIAALSLFCMRLL